MAEFDLRKLWALWLQFVLFPFLLLVLSWMTLPKLSEGFLVWPQRTLSWVLLVFGVTAFVFAFVVQYGLAKWKRVPRDQFEHRGTNCYILRITLLEFVGLCGFLLGLSESDANQMLSLVGLSIVGLLISTPSMRLLVQLAKQGS